MSPLADHVGNLQPELDALVRREGIPGAVVAIGRGDDEIVLPAGIANVGTGIESTADTIFQLGSISKLYTTTLIAQLVDAGLVALDDPVRALLHEFRVADDAATLSITTRHLLSHTSGIEGDHFIDCGRNPDALWRYVSTLEDVGLVHPPDDLYSYCNAGFAVLGRLIEEATGDHFARALRKRLLKPAGLADTMVLAEHAITRRVAAGHRQSVGQPAEVQGWTLGRFNMPMGGVLATASDVVEFARLHLRHGKTSGGKQLLGARSVADLQSPQVEQYNRSERGLGWEIFDWNGTTVIGHDGDTVGQRAFLRVIPELDGVIVILTNSMIGERIARPFLERVATDVFDVEIPPHPTADPALEIDPTRYTGIYERLHQRVAVAGGTDALEMTVIPDDLFRSADVSEHTLKLAASEPDRFVTVAPATGLPAEVVFVDPDGDGDGLEPPEYVVFGGRAHRRIS